MTRTMDPDQQWMTIGSTCGTALFTLDCEGLWGMADMVSDGLRRTIDGPALDWAYDTLLDTFDRWAVPATFAFVSFLTMPADQVLGERDRIEESPALRAWCRAALSDLDRGHTGGWCMPHLLERARSRGIHEIASHGLSHLPWLSPAVTTQDLAAEVQGVKDWSAAHGFETTGFVYPRNQVASPELLGSAGFECFRAPPDRIKFGTAGRVSNLAGEFLPLRPDLHPEPRSPVRVPGGDPIHWKSGVRRVVPRATTAARARRLLEAAAATGGVAHFWIHPHELITGHRQAELVDDVVRSIAVARSSGRIRVETMSSYARRMVMESPNGHS